MLEQLARPGRASRAGVARPWITSGSTTMCSTRHARIERRRTGPGRRSASCAAQRAQRVRRPSRAGPRPSKRHVAARRLDQVQDQRARASTCRSRTRRRGPASRRGELENDTPSTARTTVHARRPERSRRATGSRLREALRPAAIAACSSARPARLAEDGSAAPLQAGAPTGRHADAAAAVARQASRRLRAARREAAAGRQIGGVGHGARDGRQPRRRLAAEARASRAAGRGCRDGAGRRTASRTGASSTTRPAYITTTRSAISATTPRSWVMSRIAHAELAPQRRAAGRGSAPGS